jgi:N-acetylgalactosamine kinase
MGTTRLPKVCLPVAGVAAINRTLHAYRECGVLTNIVVVGADAAEVMRVVSAEFPDAIYACQRDPIGTGDAVMKGAVPLLNAGFDGGIFISVGDKVMDASAIGKVLRRFEESDADLSFVVSEKKEAADMGRIVSDSSGRPIGVVEAVEFRLAGTLRSLQEAAGKPRSFEPGELREICMSGLGAEKHLKRLGSLLRLVNAKKAVSAGDVLRLLPRNAGHVSIGRRWLSVEEALAGPPYMNESLYLAKPSALRRAFELLAKSRTGTRESYFTDIVHLLLQDEQPWIVDSVLVDHRQHLMFGFNTPGQLLELEDILRRREGQAVHVRDRNHKISSKALKPAREWIRALESRSPSAMRTLRAVYGEDSAQLENKRSEYLSTLRVFSKRFGPERAVLMARAPGSLNLMGRHMDAEGGFVNLLAIDREAVFAASPRDDDRIVLEASSPGFRETTFTIGGELAALDWDDWLQYVSSVKVRQMVTGSRGDRSNYVRAAILRLQHHFNDTRLAGMDCVVNCDIPSAAGLGAAGAIVAATCEAVVALNGLRLTPEELGRLGVEGQWFVGFDGARGVEASRGAQHHTRLGGNQVAHVRFRPPETHTMTPFPSHWRLALCFAGDDGALSLDLKNRQSSSMRLALILLKIRHPQFARLLEQVADVDAQHLGIRPSELYEVLITVPERATPHEIMGLVPPDSREIATAALATHENPRHYFLREALIYGAAECARSRALPALLASKDAIRLGEAMTVSHAAERTASPAAEAVWNASDSVMQQLVADLRSEDPDRTRRAQLGMQPGRYGASTPELDSLVDFARGTPGVIGAQLSGAGQGGCIMVVLHSEAADAAIAALARHRTSAGRAARVVEARPAPGPGILGI